MDIMLCNRILKSSFHVCITRYCLTSVSLEAKLGFLGTTEARILRSNSENGGVRDDTSRNSEDLN